MLFFTEGKVLCRKVYVRIVKALDNPHGWSFWYKRLHLVEKDTRIFELEGQKIPMEKDSRMKNLWEVQKVKKKTFCLLVEVI